MLKNKVALITGGTKGIGLATAKKLLSMGVKVYVCSRNKPDNLDSNIIFVKIDVTDEKSCQQGIKYILQENEKIDILVANAGITCDKLTKNMDIDSFKKVIDTNLVGVFNIVRLIGPLMAESGGGSIVTVSSIVGQYGNIGQVNYAASKAGVIGMSKSWAKEFARKGVPVRVNVVAPGYILTDMLKTVPAELIEKFSSQTMLKRLGKPEEVANVIAFLCSEESSYVTGSVIDVNGGMRL